MNYLKKRHTHLIYNSIKNNKIGINLTKEVIDLCNENYEALIKEIKDINKWKDILCSWIRRIIAKISISPKTIHRFNATLMNFPVAIFNTSRKLS